MGKSNIQIELKSLILRYGSVKQKLTGKLLNGFMWIDNLLVRLKKTFFSAVMVNSPAYGSETLHTILLNVLRNNQSESQNQLIKCRTADKCAGLDRNRGTSAFNKLDCHQSNAITVNNLHGCNSGPNLYNLNNNSSDWVTTTLKRSWFYLSKPTQTNALFILAVTLYYRVFGALLTWFLPKKYGGGVIDYEQPTSDYQPAFCRTSETDFV